MVTAPTRIGLAFALTLLVPAVLAVSWFWLVHGGVIADAIASERAATAQSRAIAERIVDEEFQAAARQSTCVIILDDDRRMIGPFAGPPDADPILETAMTGLAEAAANARIAAGDPAGALPLFAHAESARELSAEGALTCAALLAERDPVAGEAALTRAEARFAGTWCDLLPFDLLASLQRARWLASEASAPADDRRAALATALLVQAQRIGAHAIDAVAETMIQVLPELRSDVRFIDMRAAATAAVALAGEPAPGSMANGPAGTVLVPFDEHALAALPQSTVEQTLACAQE
ncbi:MAG: hypothetical protein KDC98_01390, partial [Planctomycetes bacterium]|nr:hypothetical protein [Planctomycetota bacterium]